MNKKGFIFDFDGVIIDTEKYHYQSWKQGFESVGSHVSEEEYIPLKSIGRDYLMTFVEKRDGIIFTEEEKLKIVNTKDGDYLDLKVNLSIADAIPGVLDYLKFLKSQNVKIAVASSSVEAGNTIREYGLQDFFDVIVDGTSGLKRKPSPEMFLSACEKLGLTPRDCVVFEDSFAGVEASNNAEMDCVYIGKIPNEKANFTIENFVGFDKLEI